MGRITKIDAVETQKNTRKKIRTAAYCRVSTDSDAQADSLNAQKEHYENYINARSDWELAGLYFDEGITGIKKDKRPDLMRMLADCRAGKIDFIITKSISRFSRNTADCLEMVRQLLDLNIPIYFEKENINTASMESELFLSILSSMAEDESVSISQNSKWSIRKRFENGSYKVGYPPYGYDRGAENMVVNPEQAVVVKEIFGAFLSGKGINTIVDDLNNRNIPSKRGGQWSANTVRSILSNEKYIGDCLLQKTYTDSQFNRHNNHGDRTQYLIQDHHEAIICREDFNAVQALIKQHRDEKGIAKGSEKYQARYAFSGRVICGECGSAFKRRTHYVNDGSYIAWCCSKHLSNREKCHMLFVRDDDLKKAFVTMVNKLVFAHQLILKPYADSLKSSSAHDELGTIQRLQTLIAENSEKLENLTRLMAQGCIDRTLYTREANRLLAQTDEYRTEIKNLNNSAALNSEKAAETINLLHFADKGVMLDAFSDELFEKFTDRIIVRSKLEYCFKLKCGLDLTERI